MRPDENPRCPTIKHQPNRSVLYLCLSCRRDVSPARDITDRSSVYLMSPSNGLNAQIFLIISNSIGRQVVGIGPDRSRFDSETSPTGFFAGFPLPEFVRASFPLPRNLFLFSVRRVRFSPPPFVINYCRRVLSTGVLIPLAVSFLFFFRRPSSPFFLFVSNFFL
jgi:hypothetical protein